MAEQLDQDTSTPERITAAAIALFYKQGYNATSLRQIAEACGLQVGSLYNHISSKEELLFGIMRGVMVELIDYSRAAVETAGDDPVDQVLAFMRASIRFHAMRQQETFIGNTELRGLGQERREAIVELRDSYEMQLRGLLDKAASAGRLEVKDAHLATFAALAICTSVARWYHAGGRLAIEDVERLLPPMFGPLALVGESLDA